MGNLSYIKKTYALGAILAIASVAPVNPVIAVPVVPNFQQGSMTSHTETSSKVTETINSMDYNTGYQFSVTGSGITASGNLSPTMENTNVTIEGVTSTWTGIGTKPTFVQTTLGSEFPVYGDVSIPRSQQPYGNPKSNRGYKRNRHYKYLLPVIAALVASPVNAETVGGVSATAAPVANSSETSDQPGNPSFTRAIYH